MEDYEGGLVLKSHPKAEKRLRRKAVNDIINSHLAKYKKIIPVNSGSDLNVFSLKEVDGMVLSIDPSSRRSSSNSTETIFVDENGNKISKTSVEILKRRLIDDHQVGELLTHSDFMIRKLSQLVIKGLDHHLL